jgi:hypothetical protein
MPAGRTHEQPGRGNSDRRGGGDAGRALPGGGRTESGGENASPRPWARDPRAGNRPRSPALLRPALFRQEADDGRDRAREGDRLPRSGERRRRTTGVVESNGSAGEMLAAPLALALAMGTAGGREAPARRVLFPFGALRWLRQLFVGARREGGCARNGARHNATTEITMRAPKFPTAGAPKSVRALEIFACSNFPSAVMPPFCAGPAGGTSKTGGLPWRRAVKWGFGLN